MDCVLSIHGLSKKYKKQMAVNGVDMHIDRGDIYGFEWKHSYQRI